MKDKTKLMDKYTLALTIYVSEQQMQYIDNKGKRATVIREMIDNEMKGGK